MTRRAGPPYSRIAPQQEHRWIPVGEKLPPDRARVAVIAYDLFDNAHLTIAALYDGAWSIPHITHWMPLPAHPEGENFRL